MNRCELLIDQVFRHKHTEAEWYELEKQFKEIIATATEEEINVLEESGCGEALYMICSGYEFERNKKG